MNRCDSLEPPTDVYTRNLASSNEESASGFAGKPRQRTEENVRSTGRFLAQADSLVTQDDDMTFFFSEMSARPFTDDLVRDNVCAFVAGRSRDVEQLEVIVEGILQFAPGMRIAIATDFEGLDPYKRYVFSINDCFADVTKYPFWFFSLCDRLMPITLVFEVWIVPEARTLAFLFTWVYILFSVRHVFYSCLLEEGYFIDLGQHG